MTKTELKNRSKPRGTGHHTEGATKAKPAAARHAKKEKTVIQIITPDKQRFAAMVTVDIVSKDSKRKSVMVSTVAGLAAGLAVFGQDVDKGVWITADDGQKTKVFAGSTLEQKWLQYTHFTVREE